MLQLFSSTYEGLNPVGTPETTVHPKAALFLIGRVNFKKRHDLTICFKMY